uniref:Uncharacterized protein n=1 Tax=Trypanosoma vivax (strain Y486) TaxID=1055687 RepID=G0U586_TRYVY|nr:hypothetical protein TVY486_1000880 [Trypanosoma vivax Y486]
MFIHHFYQFFVLTISLPHFQHTFFPPPSSFLCVSFIYYIGLVLISAFAFMLLFLLMLIISVSPPHHFTNDELSSHCANHLHWSFGFNIRHSSMPLFSLSLSLSLYMYPPVFVNTSHALVSVTPLFLSFCRFLFPSFVGVHMCGGK